MEVKFYPSFSETKLKNYISKQIYRSWTHLHHYGDRICTSALVSNNVPLIIILATIIPPPLIKVLHIYHGEPSTSALITDTCNGTIYPATMWNYTKNSLFWLCFHNVKCELNYTVRKKKYTVLPDFFQAKRINVKKKSFCSFFNYFYQTVTLWRNKDKIIIIMFIKCSFNSTVLLKEAKVWHETQI